MEKQNPFSLYDFLGYLVPGAIFVCGIVFFYGVLTSIGRLQINWLHSFEVFARPSLYLPLVLLSYMLGHIFSFLSTITVERFQLWTIGYPSRFLLGSKQKEKPDKKWIAGIIRLIVLPVSVIDSVVRKIKTIDSLFAKSLEEPIINALKAKIHVFAEQEAGIKPGDLDKCDVFRLIYHYVVEHSSNHLIKLQNYVALYGFLRTLCFISVVYFWISTVLAFISICGSDIWVILPFVGFTAAFAVASWVLYLDFLKFSRRFTLEALMALHSIYPKQESGDLINGNKTKSSHR